MHQYIAWASNGLEDEMLVSYRITLNHYLRLEWCTMTSNATIFETGKVFPKITQNTEEPTIHVNKQNLPKPVSQESPIHMGCAR